MPSQPKSKVQRAGHGKALASILEPMDLVEAVPSATKGALESSSEYIAIYVFVYLDLSGEQCRLGSAGRLAMLVECGHISRAQVTVSRAAGAEMFLQGSF